MQVEPFVTAIELYSEQLLLSTLGSFSQIGQCLVHKILDTVHMHGCMMSVARTPMIYNDCRMSNGAPVTACNA